jgi:hypothetical protein
MLRWVDLPKVGEWRCAHGPIRMGVQMDPYTAGTGGVLKAHLPQGVMLLWVDLPKVGEWRCAHGPKRMGVRMDPYIAGTGGVMGSSATWRVGDTV